MSDYPRYDPRSECKKCGSWDVDSKYLRGMSVDLFLGLIGILALAAKRPWQAMGRTCTWCGFKWLERLGGGGAEEENDFDA